MKNMIISVLATFLLSLPAAYATKSDRSTSPQNTKLYIISPANGDTVDETFTVKFGLSGMGVSPAGLDKKNTGHHHLLIDASELPALDKPMGSEVMHFGGGQTEKTITLTKGKHTLQLILGNYQHVPHDKPVISGKITITVK